MNFMSCLLFNAVHTRPNLNPFLSNKKPWLTIFFRSSETSIGICCDWNCKAFGQVMPPVGWILLTLEEVRTTTATWMRPRKFPSSSCLLCMYSMVSSNCSRTYIMHFGEIELTYSSQISLRYCRSIYYPTFRTALTITRWESCSSLGFLCSRVT